MEGIWSTSLLFPPQAPVSPPAALFCGEDEYGCHLEVNPRVDGSVYVCGCGGSKYLDNAALAALDPKDVTPNPARVKAVLVSWKRNLLPLSEIAKRRARMILAIRKVAGRVEMGSRATANQL